MGEYSAQIEKFFTDCEKKYDVPEDHKDTFRDLFMQNARFEDMFSIADIDTFQEVYDYAVTSYGNIVTDHKNMDAFCRSMKNIVITPALKVIELNKAGRETLEKTIRTYDNTIRLGDNIAEITLALYASKILKYKVNA